MFIERHIKNVIDEYRKEFPVVLITGPRQVGKSTILRTKYPNIPYITLDDRFVLNQMNNEAKGYIQSLGVPVIFDEIQRAANAFIDFKLIIDSNRQNGMYIFTGSQKYELMKRVSDSLTGRIGVLNMLGLSNREIYNEKTTQPFLPTKEYLSARNPQHSLTNNELWERIHRGSMPELYDNPNYNWEHFYSSYIQTYLDRDVNQLAQVGNLMTFSNFISVLASRTGQLLNLASIATEVGIDQRTAKNWLSILEATNMVFLLHPFSLNATKRVVKTPKIYFTDTGIVCYLCRWLTAETAQNGAMAGALYETFVISEIVKSYYNAGKDLNIYYFRDSNANEVDLLFYINGCLYPIEIKKTAYPNIKDIKNFKVLEDCFPTIKVAEGGIVCNYESLSFLNEKNNVIPLRYI